jgi:hypothetical protein
MFDSSPRSSSVGLLQDSAFIRQVSSPYTDEEVTTYLTKIDWVSDLPDGGSRSAVSAFDASLHNLSKLIILHTLAFPQDTSDYH